MYISVVIRWHRGPARHLFPSHMNFFFLIFCSLRVILLSVMYVVLESLLSLIPEQQWAPQSTFNKVFNAFPRSFSFKREVFSKRPSCCQPNAGRGCSALSIFNESGEEEEEEEAVFKTICNERKMFLTTLITWFWESSAVLCSKPFRLFRRESAMNSNDISVKWKFTSVGAFRAANSATFHYVAYLRDKILYLTGNKRNLLVKLKRSLPRSLGDKSEPVSESEELVNHLSLSHSI